ncbi:MAG: DUF3604 domain-containing protein, partial [Gammaproteobacteria bacterium]|nr:DUF3604 domain-containing protein [Gammaproteobacteria bacterium]
TSGPRIKARLFAGYDMSTESHSGAIPQGGELVLQAKGVPSFLAWAVSDPLGTKLQRLQVIKGWVEGGHHREKVYDVACSDGFTVDTTTHRCPDNGAKVDISNCNVSEDKGAGELKALWQDPEFNKHQRAFYYVRVLENPTCRWSTWDAVRAGTTPRPDLAMTIQERAWTSPIWTKPQK